MNTDEYVKMMETDPSGMTVPGKPRGNRYLEMMEEEASTHQAQFAASTNLAAGTNPDEEARKKRIANLLGAPVAAVDGNPTLAKELATAKQLEQDTADAPGLRQKYTDVDFAKLAHDQSANLGLIERTLRNFVAGFGGDFLGSSIKGMGHTLNSAQRLLRDKASYDAWMKEWAPLGQGLVEAGENVKKYYQDFAPTDESSFSDQVVRGVAQMTGQLPTMIASAPLGIAMMYGQGADQMADKIARDKVAQKADQANKDLEVLSGGAITAVTEWASSKLLLKPPALLALKSKLLAYAAKIALGGVEEGIQELSENIGQDLIHMAATNPEGKVAFGEAIQAGGVGAIVGVVASGVIQGALHIRARGVQAAFAKLSEETKEQKLRERDPETYQSFADTVTAHLANTSDGPVENLYVDGNTFKQGLAAAKLDPDEVGRFMPHLVEQMDEAAATGGDVVISLSDYVGKIAGTELGDVLNPHLRSAPDAVSVAEMEAASKLSGDLQTQADEIMSRSEQRAEFIKSANEVQKTIFDQINSTGAYAAPVSRAYASMVRDFYVTAAANMGVTPMEMYEAHPYKVTSGSIAPDQVMQGKEVGEFVTVYRGEYSGNKRGNYHTTDPEFARQFTQSGQDKEITQSSIRAKEIYYPPKEVYAGDPDLVDTAVQEAKDLGYKAIELSEGQGQPNSIYVFDKTALKSAREYTGDILNQSDEADKAWKNWEPEITSTGKIKGSPEWVNDKADLKSMRLTLRKFVQEGSSGRYWYEKSAKAIMQMMNNDVVKAEKFIQLIAIYSPNSNVWVNTIQAVKAYTHWASGRPANTLSVGSEVGDGKAIDVLYNGKDWEGRKTNSFYLNLMHDIVANYPGEVNKLNLDPEFIQQLSLPVTVDVWVGRAFGYENTGFSDDKGTGKYSFSENEIRRLTARLNGELKDGQPKWTPHQVQAAIWTAIKSRFEMKEVKEKTNRKSLRDGVLKIVDGVLVYPKDPEGSHKHLANWRHFAMQPTSAVATQAAEDNGRSFGDDLDRMTEVVTWEAIPTTSLKYDIHNASPEVKRLFTEEAKNILIDGNGNDLLAVLLGVPLSYSGLGYGAYAGGVNSNVLSHLLPARLKGEGFSLTEVREYCRAIQYIFKQDAVPWFRPDNKAILSNSASQKQRFRVLNKDGKTLRTFDTQAEAESYAAKKEYTVRGGDLARALAIQFNHSLDSSELSAVLSSLQGYLGDDVGFTRTAANEITIVNFRDDSTKLPFIHDEDFLSALETFLGDNSKKLNIEAHKQIWAEGEYGNVENWTEGPSGSQILESGSLSGRPDLHARLRDWRNAFDQLLTKYSGENLASIGEQETLAQSTRRRADQASQDVRTGSEGKSREGAISAVGVHYSKAARQELDSSFFGTGAASSEAARLEGQPDLQDRIYFYTNTGQGVSPEPFVGKFAHTADLNNVYDKETDPLNLMVGRDANAFERAVMAAGYDGILDRNWGVIVLLGKRTIPVKSVKKLGKIPEVAAPRYSSAQLLSQELKANEDLPEGFLSGPEWIETLREDHHELYKKLDAAGYIEPLRTQTEPIKRTSIPFVGEAAKTFYQASPSDKRGGFNPSSLTTILTEQSDYSTFLHETAHFFLTTYAEMASSPTASPKIKDDMQVLLDWFGVPDLATWNAMSIEEQRKHHEAFAYNYEVYLFEAKAPNAKMQGVFERFSAWLKRIYTSITTELNQIYRQEHGVDLPILTGEVRQVMDRMLASDEQIEQAEQIRGMSPVFRSQEESGMDDAEWTAYTELQQEAHETALATHRAASLRQMKWLSNMRSKMLSALQATTRDIRKGILAEVTEEVNAMPIYRAKAALQGASEIEALAIADGLGYSSVDALKAAIASAPRKADVIAESTDLRMLEEYGELATPEALSKAVDEAVHNQARARFIGVELRHLSKTTRPVRIMQEAAAQAARAILGKKSIRDIRPRDYTGAEAKAAAAAATAMASGDTAAATQAKEHQLLQNQLAAEALAANTRVAKSIESFKKVFNSDKRLSKSRDMNYVNVARAILAHYGVGTTEQPASFYLAKIKAYDPEFYAEIEPMITAHQLQSKPLKDLTLEEFTDLSDQIQALWHISRRNKQIEIDGQLMDRKAVVEILNDVTRDLTRSPKRAGYDKAMTKWQETKIKLLGMRAAMRRVENWVDVMDGGAPDGPFRKYIWNPISEAVIQYRLAKEDYMIKYLDLVKGIEKLLGKDEIAAPEIGYTFTSQELLHAILHTGNDSNKRKLLLGRGWAALNEDGKTIDTSRWDSFIARAQKDGILTKDHYDFCQKVWDLLEQMKPAAQKAHRQMYGFYFAEITATPFETPFGIYAGGYVPAVTDPNLVSDSAMRNEQETQLVDNSFMFPSTGRGFTMGRVEYNKPLLLNLGYMASHMDKVLRFTHIEPKIKDVARIVKTNRSFGEAMDELDQTVRGDMLVPWLQRTAMQLVSMPSKGWGGKAADSVFRFLRTNAGMQMMVANITNTLQQFTGVSISMIKVRPALLRNALWQYIRHPADTAQMVIDHSDFMKTRMTSVQYELQRTMDELLLNPNKYEKMQDFANKHGYFMQTATQGIVDTITWVGAYNEAVELGVDEKEAVRRANSAVRMTQGSFAPEDVSRIETGSAFLRAFTHFYSYFNMMANLLGSEFQIVANGIGCKAGAGRLLYLYTFGFMVPAVLSEMIVQAAGGFDAGDDDEYGLWDAMRLFFSAQARPIAAMFPGLGPALIAGFNTWNNKQYDDRMSTSPAVATIESTVRAPHSVYKAIAEEGSWSRASKDFLTGLGMLTRLPLGQLGKPIGYSLDVAQGKVSPESFMDVARGLLSGKDVNRKQ